MIMAFSTKEELLIPAVQKLCLVSQGEDSSGSGTEKNEDMVS